MNGIEGSLAIAALYYYLHLKPVNFSREMSIMTFLITMAFLCRSSSLAVWIPLAIFKIVEDFNFFVPIVLAGLTVTLPACLASVALDSFYYGRLTVPQLNFININIV